MLIIFRAYRVIEQDAQAEAEKVGNGVLQLAGGPPEQRRQLAPGLVVLPMAADLPLQPLSQFELAYSLHGGENLFNGGSA